MANEELNQRGYLVTGKLRGKSWGDFEELDLGATRVSELVTVGLEALVPSSVDYPFRYFKPPQTPNAAKPDRVFVRRENSHLRPVAVAEWKASSRFASDKARQTAFEQALYNGSALGTKVAIATDGARFHYVDVEASALAADLRFFNETRDLNPGVLSNLLAGDAGVVKDPRALAETVWQIIWHATKAEPRECLLTFVEIFVLKFLSDNLPKRELPDSLRFYELLTDPAEFSNRHGRTAIEYYISAIRPHIKSLFPDNTLSKDPRLGALFGLTTIVSKTSVIDGFAFLRSSGETISSFNRVFLEILEAFHAFGPLSAIDPEFKLRLYETFLRRSARQQRLGQFFTPRNIVRPMIRMAQLDRLPDDAVVLDPAAGVGGFVLEPLLFDDALPDNIAFGNGGYKRRVVTVGADVDDALHILAKANMLLHLAEDVRDQRTTLGALNEAMADTFVLMNHNLTLGSLEYPPIETVDVVLTNPPYVTEGSAIFKEEMKDASTTPDGKSLYDYYDGSGLGVEALFLRYIAGALKRGGRAFVVVPMGLLNRTERGPKARLLEQCDVLASIQLPRGAFFNTMQPAYVLVLGKRHSAADTRPEIFCAMARTIGESLDWQRVSTPLENDLAEIAELFVAFDQGDRVSAEGSLVVKLVSASEFTADDRWDVARFWTDDELVELGEKTAAITRLDFIEDARVGLDEIVSDFEEARQELEQLTSASRTATFELSDESRFVVRSGTRIRNEDIREHPGNIPVYSCFTNSRAIKGLISETWLKSNDIRIEERPMVTVMANGAKAVGKVFVRDPGVVLTDDVIAVEPLTDDIDLDYLAVALRSAIAGGGYVYEAKLFVRRVKGLTVEFPINADGSPDIKHQREVAAAVKRFDSIRDRLAELGARSAEARIK